MNNRLSAQDWIDFAMRTLAREGFEAIKADILARKLGVTRGSLYWHFEDISAFHGRVIDHWKSIATEAIIADIERNDSQERRIEALLRHAFGDGAALEMAIRNWASRNKNAAQALREVDHRRLSYIDGTLTELGIAPAFARIRAEILYWAYLGAALSRSAPSSSDLDLIVGELKAFATRSV
jgi:AcrR family transcriptional regulator